jgi:hypothetical protein
MPRESCRLRSVVPRTFVVRDPLARNRAKLLV